MSKQSDWSVCVTHVTNGWLIVLHAITELWLLLFFSPNFGRLEVYVGSVGHGVQWDAVTEYHSVPVHRANVCASTPFFIPSSPRPTEHRVPLNPRIVLSMHILTK